MLLLLQALPPVRSKIKRTSIDQKSKHDKQNERPVRISGYDYTAWDKFNVVSFTLTLFLPMKQVLRETLMLQSC